MKESKERRRSAAMGLVVLLLVVLGIGAVVLLSKYESSKVPTEDEQEALCSSAVDDGVAVSEAVDVDTKWLGYGCGAGGEHGGT